MAAMMSRALAFSPLAMVASAAVGEFVYSALGRRLRRYKRMDGGRCVELQAVAVYCPSWRGLLLLALPAPPGA